MLFWEDIVTRTLSAAVVAVSFACIAALYAQGTPKNYKGIELSIGGVERASRRLMNDRARKTVGT